MSPFRNVMGEGTGGQFSKIIDRTKLPKIARQFHTSPFSLCCRDGVRSGEKKKGKEADIQEGEEGISDKLPADRCVAEAQVMAVAPKTNYSDKPNYLPPSSPLPYRFVS